MSPTPDLFAATAGAVETLAPGAFRLQGFALGREAALDAGIDEVTAASPWRYMETPGGRAMSVAITNCGRLGWVSDRRGYRYDPRDPLTGDPWPAMPAAFRELAVSAAGAAGFAAFEPDACLINRYDPGARLSLHQDKNERDFRGPSVSVSLGLPAVFLFGGGRRADRPQRLPLSHGDVLVWGGPARLRYHGVAALAPGMHPFAGACRINLTFRCAG